MDLPDRGVDACLEAAWVLEGTDADGGEEVAVLPGSRAALHVAEFGAIGGAGKHGGEDAHEHGQARSLEAANGHQEAVNCRGGIGCRDAVAIHRPAFGERPAALLIDADLAV